MKCFFGQSCFFCDEAQPYWIFDTFCYTLRRILITLKVISWEFKGLSSESIVTTDNKFLQQLYGMQIFV